jgi:hypothetical protein
MWVRRTGLIVAALLAVTVAQPNAEEISRGFVETYLAGRSERALARKRSGTDMWTTYGARFPQDARKSAVESCEMRGRSCGGHHAQ